MSIFIPTGEIREPKEGESYKTALGDGCILRASCNFHDDETRKIYKEVTEEEYLSSLWKDPQKEMPSQDDDWKDMIYMDSCGETSFGRWNSKTKTIIQKSSGYQAK